MSRPVIEMDTRELEKLCSLQCTQEEIAAWFGVTRRTIELRVASDKLYEHSRIVDGREYTSDMTFKEIMDRGYAQGRISLRRRQFQIAEGGSAAMAIFLGKNLLGQRDQHSFEHTGAAGAPLISGDAVDSILERLASTDRTPDA